MPSFLITMLGALAALTMAFPFNFTGFGDDLQRYELFSGMLVYDRFSIYVRALLIAFTVLFAIFTRLSGVPDRDDAADFYTLILGATIGMCLMASANHLLMVFMAIEMASVPSYALAAMLKGRKESSEAALKYAVYGAGAAGVMLYGISLLAGLVGSAHFPSIALRLAEMLPAMAGGEKMVLALAGLMIFVGLAFKLSAFPFHFWCPDVFEGASAEVDAFLSIASKAGAMALLVRVCLGMGLLPHGVVGPPPEPTFAQAAVVAAAEDGGAVFAIQDEVDSTATATATAVDALAPVRNFMALLIACLAAITCTFGNLAAYAQTNMKRLLAYSTIAHAGYMLLPIPAALWLFGRNNVAASDAIASLATLSRDIPVYEFDCVRDRRIPAERFVQRANRRLWWSGQASTGRCRLYGHRHVQPRRYSAACRLYWEVSHLCCAREWIRHYRLHIAAGIAGDRWREYGDQPVLLSPCNEGYGDRSRVGSSRYGELAVELGKRSLHCRGDVAAVGAVFPLEHAE